MKRFISGALGLLLAGSVQAHDLLDLDEMMAAFGWDFATAEITVEKLNDGFYVLFGIVEQARLDPDRPVPRGSGLRL